MIDRVLGVDFPVLEHSEYRVPLYPHQAAMLDAWDQHSTLLLTSGTGSGKTRAAILPVLSRRQYAMAVYPTNELLRDQVRAVAKVAAEEGIRARIFLPETQADVGDCDTLLIPLDGDLLDRWQGPRGSRPEALRKLLSRNRPRIIFTNPDILFNILAAYYHLDALAPLSVYHTIIFDEFHLYHGVELVHALMIVFLARGLGFFEKVVLLSATPHPDMDVVLDRVLHPFRIPMSASSGSVQFHRAVHEVQLSPIMAGTDTVDQIASRLLEWRPTAQELRTAHPDDDYIPAVAIVNSVLDAIRLEDELTARGVDRNSMAIVRGLSNRAIRERSGKLFALGTSAIEVGVDFDCDALFFEAIDAASFLQRFGRVGRHRAGEAFVIVPPNAFTALMNVPTIVSRRHFEGLIYSCFRRSDARPWFVSTVMGLLSAASIPERLFEMVARDCKASEELLRRFRQKLDAILTQYAATLGCEEIFVRAMAMLHAHRKRIPALRWYETYLQINTFRTSLPSVEIHDWREHGRRGDWPLGTYTIDLATLLRRGRNIRKQGRAGLTISGIGRALRVHAGESTADLPRGVPLRTCEHPILLMQDGLDTPVSDYLSVTDHIFCVVPRAEVEYALDWRIMCFEAGENVVAFDGTALLVIEMWKRTRAEQA